MPLSVLRIDEILLDYLQNKLPNRKAIEISKVTSLSKGWQTELFSFTYKYQLERCEHKEQLILRIYPKAHSLHVTQKEYRVLELLYEARYPVPKVHFLELDSKFFGYPFIIMEKISGIDMGEEFLEFVKEGDLVSLEKYVLETLNTLFVKLHSLDWHKHLPILTSYSELKKENYWIEKLKQLENRIEKDHLFELSPILNWLKDNSSKINPVLSIIHGDFHPHNIMMSDEGIAYVVDWPDASIGDYREDLGWTLMLTGAYTGKEVRNLVLKSYETIKGSEIEDIEYFEVVSAVRRLRDMILLFKRGPEKAGLREEAIKQIKENLYHVENIVDLVKEVTKKDIPQIEEFIQSILIS